MKAGSGVFDDDEEPRPRARGLRLKAPSGVFEGGRRMRSTVGLSPLDPDGPELSPFLELEKLDREKKLAEAGAFKGRLESGTMVWAPNHPSWNVEPPYEFRPYLPKFGGPCCYCAEKIRPGERGVLYSPKLKSIAHESCRAGRDL